jgi:hypothetical protein
VRVVAWLARAARLAQAAWLDWLEWPEWLEWLEWLEWPMWLAVVVALGGPVRLAAVVAPGREHPGRRWPRQTSGCQR